MVKNKVNVENLHIINYNVITNIIRLNNTIIVKEI